MESLKDRGIYRFSITMRTPFAGHPVIASQSQDGFELFTPEEWSTLAPPRLTVDASGRLLYYGRPTGYRADVLVDTGETVE